MKLGKARMLILLIILIVSLTPAAAEVYKNGVTIHNGLYSADGFGANYYFGLRYNHYLSNWNYFVEVATGFSKVRSDVLDDIAQFQLFDSNRLFEYEFVFGYDRSPLTNFPYVVAGVAGVKQGGQSNFAYVLGLGKQIPLAQFSNHKNLGLRYDIRDQIFKQKLNGQGSYTAHNLILSLGLQYYF